MSNNRDRQVFDKLGGFGTSQKAADAIWKWYHPQRKPPAKKR
jgi:hypothetical protein